MYYMASASAKCVKMAANSLKIAGGHLEQGRLKYDPEDILTVLGIPLSWSEVTWLGKV